MPTYDITVKVTYFYEVEADSEEEAEKQGWMYEDYAYNAEVDEIKVSEQEEDDEVEASEEEEE